MSLKPRRPLLLPLAPLFHAGTRLRAKLYDIGALPVSWLEHPVLSVGSLSAGGAGKTPLVLLLADLLARDGYGVSILSRGYGRQSRLVTRVDPNGTPADFGDEPLLLARRLDALQTATDPNRLTASATSPPPSPAVFVGSSRLLAGQLAEASLNPNQEHFYLLDDGFQHRQLGRDVDLVLLTRQDLTEAMLPAGNLREPLAALHRAHILVLREDELGQNEVRLDELCQDEARDEGPRQDKADAFQDTLSALRRRRPELLCWTLRRSLTFSPTPGASLPQRPFVFSAIARPENFTAMLRVQGIQPAATRHFPDHHAYTVEEVHRLIDLAAAAHADGWITTEKDAVKLTSPMSAALERLGPLTVARLHLKLLSAGDPLTELLTLVDRGNQQREETALAARVL